MVKKKEKKENRAKVFSRFILGLCEDGIGVGIHKMKNDREIFNYSVRSDFNKGDSCAEIVLKNGDTIFTKIKILEYGEKKAVKQNIVNKLKGVKKNV